MESLISGTKPPWQTDSMLCYNLEGHGEHKKVKRMQHQKTRHKDPGFKFLQSYSDEEL